MPKERTQAYYYCKTYRDAVKQYEGRLPERALHDRAQRVADGAKFILPLEEHRACNRWLDGEYPIRLKKPEEDRPPGLFDDVLHAE